MNDAARWILVLGCLLLAILEAPHAALVLVEDLRGPWRAAESAPSTRCDAAPIVVPTSRSGLQTDGAVASLAPEDLLGLACCASHRLAARPVPGPLALGLSR